MSYFINKIDQVRKMFFNKETIEPEKTVKKMPNKIEIKETIEPEHHLESYKTNANKNTFDISYDDDDELNYESDIDDIYDDMPYTFKNLYSEQVSTYHYINDRLSRTFGSCMDYDS